MPWTKNIPFEAELLVNRRLSAEGADQDFRHIELSLAGSGIEYEPGDSLGVWPVNEEGLVEELLSRCVPAAEETVIVKGETFSPREALLRKLDVTHISRDLIKAVSEKLEKRWLAEHRVIDVLETHPPELTPRELCERLRPLQPRLYSISSSLRAHSEEAHLTVVVVRFEADRLVRLGVSSSYLADRVERGDKVRVYVQPSPRFRLPRDDSRPIIMVGPGSGIAPFRSFLEERRERGAAGKNWLFFGSRRRATSFLYQDEFERMRASGLLTRLDLAFSRDQPERIYVQHRMRENAAELWRWIDAQGACFYVCGEARHMGRDVDAELQRIIAEEGGLDEEATRSYVKRLRGERRYVRETY